MAGNPNKRLVFVYLMILFGLAFIPARTVFFGKALFFRELSNPSYQMVLFSLLVIFMGRFGKVNYYFRKALYILGGYSFFYALLAFAFKFIFGGGAQYLTLFIYIIFGASFCAILLLVYYLVKGLRDKTREVSEPNKTLSLTYIFLALAFFALAFVIGVIYIK